MKTYLFAAKNSSVTITLSATDEIDAWALLGETVKDAEAFSLEETEDEDD